MAKRKRPFWLPEPCPTWCMGGHSKREDGEDRHHMSRWDKSIVLTTMDTVRHVFTDRTSLTRPKVCVWIDQGVREISPRIIVEDSQGKKHYELTIDEATRLASALVTAVQLGGAA